MHPTPNRVNIEPNVPTDLAFRWTDGVNLKGQYGPCVRFVTMDNKTLLLPEPAANQLRALKLQPGETVRVCKHQAGRQTHWKFEKTAKEGEQPDGTFQVRAPEGKAIANGARNGQPPSSNSRPDTDNHNTRPATRLEDALCTAVAACHRAHKYAEKIGYAAMPQFSSEDIRTMANTLLIGPRGGQPR